MTDDTTPVDPNEDGPVTPLPEDPDAPDPVAEEPPSIGDTGEEPHD